MDRTIVIPMSAPIPHGHRVEVIERVGEDAERSVLLIADLDARIRYQHGAGTVSDGTLWTGRVLECTITTSRNSVSTTLLIDPIGPGSGDADVALRGADAAADAAKGEALRWGGADRPPQPEAPRFW